MANFNFLNLTSSVRQKMITEVEADISTGQLFISGRLNPIGVENYPEFLKESINNGDEEYLERLISNADCLNETEEYDGGKIRKVPKNAATLIAQSEFNRFYIRGLCLESIENGVSEVEIYRARQSSWARPESEALIGVRISATELLADLRNSIGTAPQLLPDVNSGLSVKI